MSSDFRRKLALSAVLCLFWCGPMFMKALEWHWHPWMNLVSLVAMLAYFRMACRHDALELYLFIPAEVLLFVGYVLDSASWWRHAASATGLVMLLAYIVAAVVRARRESRETGLLLERLRVLRADDISPTTRCTTRGAEQCHEPEPHDPLRRP